jgi:hypothetical protein
VAQLMSELREYDALIRLLQQVRWELYALAK